MKQIEKKRFKQTQIKKYRTWYIRSVADLYIYTRMQPQERSKKNNIIIKENEERIR